MPAKRPSCMLLAASLTRRGPVHARTHTRARTHTQGVAVMVATHSHQNPHSSTVTLTTEVRELQVMLLQPWQRCVRAAAATQRLAHCPAAAAGGRLCRYPRGRPALWVLPQCLHAGPHRQHDRLLQWVGGGSRLPGHGRGEVLRAGWEWRCLLVGLRSPPLARFAQCASSPVATCPLLVAHCHHQRQYRWTRRAT